MDQQDIPDVVYFVEACRRGDLPTVQDVLRNSPSVLNQVDTPGWTGLHYAIHANHYDVAQFLLQNKADPNIVNGAGETPLVIAAVKNYPDLVCLLISAGADAKVVNNAGLTAYDLAPNDTIRNALLGRDPNTVSSGCGYLIHQEESDSD